MSSRFQEMSPRFQEMSPRFQEVSPRFQELGGNALWKGGKIFYFSLSCFPPPFQGRRDPRFSFGNGVTGNGVTRSPFKRFYEENRKEKRKNRAPKFLFFVHLFFQFAFFGGQLAFFFGPNDIFGGVNVKICFRVRFFKTLYV